MLFPVLKSMVSPPRRPAGSRKLIPRVLPGQPELAGSLAEDLCDHLFSRKITAPAGGVVFCRLAIHVEHSGLALGDGSYIHLDGSGRIERVGPKAFLARLGGWNPAFSIYVGCDAHGQPIAHPRAARVARALVGKFSPYHLLDANCHHFVASLVWDQPPTQPLLSIADLAALPIQGQSLQSWRACY